MSATAHPSQPGRSNRPCWCYTTNAKYGCHQHGPIPLDRDDWVQCRTCTTMTKNRRDRLCDDCDRMTVEWEAQITAPMRGLLNQFHFNDIPDHFQADQ